MKRICFIVASPGTARSFLLDHIKELSRYYEVYLVANSRDDILLSTFSQVGFKEIDIIRNISFFKDIKALISLTRFFKESDFDAVHSVTPKAGLLTAIAGFIAGVPVRIHIFTGQVWANKKGIKRWILKFMDRIIVLFGNHFLVDSEGQRQFLIMNHILTEKNSRVLGEGSISGVNLSRFVPNDNSRREARDLVKVDDDKLVFVFMGRLNYDKGVYELLSSFDRLASENDNVFLLLVGPDEEDVTSHFKEYCHLSEENNFLYYGHTSEPQRILQAGDVFVLPSHREGFGSSVIEAAALGIPAICSDVYGLYDAMIDNVTGIRCRVGDSESLYFALKKYADNPKIVRIMGKAARDRAVSDFDGNALTQLWVDYYHSLL